MPEKHSFPRISHLRVAYEVDVFLRLLSWLLFQQLVSSCNDGARRMERTEQMYTIQKQMDFGKIKVRGADHRFLHKHLPGRMQFDLNVGNQEKALDWFPSCSEDADPVQTKTSQPSFANLGWFTLVSSQPFPLVSSSRWLRKRGELAVCTEELSIWRAFSHRSYYLFLFNDVLIVTKKKRSVGLTHTVIFILIHKNLSKYSSFCQHNHNK